METAKTIRSGFQKLFEKIRTATEISEEEVRVKFVESGVLEALGYKGILKDVRLERGVKGKRSDLLAFDDYQNVIFVIEFKRPNVLDVDQDFAQLWERYVKPLRARYGVLTDGLELLVYERINSNWERKLQVNLGEITVSHCEEVYGWLQKPKIEREEVTEVLKYFDRFDNPAERVNLSTEIAQQHFFESFELKEGSIFVNLVQKTIVLFDFELQRSKFLTSAYEFWKVSYAKKPEKIPENWRRIMATMGLEATEENLFKFMFCLESAYSLFTRLILAKACEDYKLPYVEFSRFIKTEIEHIAFSYRGSIPLLAWAITTKNLIESMRQRLVQSVFEGDIFYWWEDSYREISAGDALYSPKLGKPRAQFGEALAEIIFTLYKFDFSEIVGDPLGTLYQRYFDKETRKALGEFYTPLEVVTYILDAVGYEGRSVLGKRLLDPACGSGTFLVEALRRYLKASEQIAEEKGWSKILEELCNEYRIVGFDIHPFATFMAQMQIMLVLIPAYKRAMDEDRHFVLSRLPIFRTDSLVDETKGEMKKVTLETFEEGIQYLLVDTGLPAESVNLKIQLPYFKDVIAKAGLPNAEAYFAALQAVFDTVKAAAWEERYTFTKAELERNFKRYLMDKDWNALVSYFTPYAEHFLQKFKELKETFGNGKLIKSLEDIMLAAILKNYVKYDFVVGNPPYVRVQTLEEKQKDYLKELYKAAKGKFDLYILFIERGILWLKEDGRFGFIVSNQFMVTDYGVEIRSFILSNTKINQIINFGDSGVFADATNYPAILILQKNTDRHHIEENIIRAVKVHKPTVGVMNTIQSYIHNNEYSNDTINIFNYHQSDLDVGIWNIVQQKEKYLFEKIEGNSSGKLNSFVERIFQGIKTGNDSVFYLNTSSDVKRDQKTNNLLIKVTPQNSTASFFVEQELLRPLLKGNEIRKYRIDWGGLHVLYPHKKEKEKGRIEAPVMHENELRDRYPCTYNYLLKHKKDLEKRKYLMDSIQKGIRDEWYEIWNPRLPERFKRMKIITPSMSNRNNFAFDREGKFYTTGPIYGIILVSQLDQVVNYLFFLGVLNSKLQEFYFKHIATIKSGKFYEYRTQYLSQLPIKLPQTTEEQALADEITNKVELILEQVKIGQKIGNFSEEYIKEFRNKGEEFTSFSLCFNSNHKTLEPEITENVDGQGYNILPDKKETFIYVDSKVKVDYVVAALKGKRTKKDEKLQLLVPKSDAVVKSILTELEEDKVKVKSPSVVELEAEINELVYKLYGLNDEDVKVIEDFLRRF